MDKKYVLITGVAGLIGSRLADWIIENKPDYCVVGVDNLFGGYEENINKNVIFYNKELSSDDLSGLFEKYNFEYVFHFAAYAAEGLSPFMRMFNYSNNVLSTVNIINNCINFKTKRLIYTSSMSVYGNGKNNGERFDENDIPSPIDPYAVSKYACEMDIKIAGEQHGLDWCIIRPHNIYGKSQNIWDKYRNVIGIWMNKIINNEPMLIYGDGKQVRAFSFIDDCLPCLWNAATFETASKEIINLGGIQGYTINEAANILCKITRTNNIEYAEERHEVKYAVSTFQKSIDILKYEDNHTLEEGLKIMWEWAKKQPKRHQFKWDKYEITDKIYSYWK